MEDVDVRDIDGDWLSDGDLGICGKNHIIQRSVQLQRVLASNQYVQRLFSKEDGAWLFGARGYTTIPEEGLLTSRNSLYHDRSSLLHGSHLYHAREDVGSLTSHPFIRSEDVFG